MDHVKKCDCTLEELVSADPDTLGSACVQALQVEHERLVDENKTLKNVLRGDEEQLKQWRNRLLEMQNDLIKTVNARDLSRQENDQLKADIEELKAAEAHLGPVS